MECKISNYF